MPRKRLTSIYGIKKIRTVGSYGASSDILDHFAIVTMETNERDIDILSIPLHLDLQINEDYLLTN